PASLGAAAGARRRGGAGRAGGGNQDGDLPDAVHHSQVPAPGPQPLAPGGPVEPDAAPAEAGQAAPKGGATGGRRGQGGQSPLQSPLQAPVRPPVRRGPAPGGPMGAGAPVAKALNFKASGLRFLALLKPERFRIAATVALTIVSVWLGVVGPKILGEATNRVFEGFMGKMIGQQLVQAGLLAQGETMPKAEVMELLRAIQQSPPPNAPALNDRMYEMLDAMNFTAGQGVDFAAVGWILIGVLAVYLGSALLGYVQGIITAKIIQNSMYRLRADVEAKLGRLPLRYFDAQPKGEVLSRVTNDIDNVGQSLQQTMTQLLFAVFNLLGILVMMLTLSFWLTLIALVSIPLAAIITALIAKRSQPQFIKQWASTGELNSHIEEMYSGHALVRVFGRGPAARAEFEARNRALYEASFKAQAISMSIQPAMGFVSNLVYVLIAVIGGLRVASGTMSLGAVQAFVQYSRQFSQPVGQVASMMNLLQSGVASVERVFDLLDAAELSPDPARPARLDQFTGRVDFNAVEFSYEAGKDLIQDLRLWAKPGQTVAIVGPTGAGKTT
ncbi:MAG: ABC transporter ATP-binding protein, partial [Bifidobacteriaceae bacterium]|nr:ABC transporter ATP-binding protein [Bifidobacteriaceae bacterium]